MLCRRRSKNGKQSEKERPGAEELHRVFCNCVERLEKNEASGDDGQHMDDDVEKFFGVHGKTPFFTKPTDPLVSSRVWLRTDYIRTTPAMIRTITPAMMAKNVLLFI